MFFGFEDYSNEGVEKYKGFSGWRFGILWMTGLGLTETKRVALIAHKRP